ncbi:hypothetical protein [Sphingomonas sp. Leaf339]|nr:hypothetical protein [Sphingomonas sp. Leaf339]
MTDRKQDKAADREDEVTKPDTDGSDAGSAGEGSGGGYGNHAEPEKPAAQ